jgi:hypothetical protein
MIDYPQLMDFLSVPRPTGTAAERKTARSLRDWLSQHNIDFKVHSFHLYPFFFECIGIWLILSRTLLAIAVWDRWGWLTLPIALVGLLGGILDIALNVPMVTWLGACRGENIIIEFEPPEAKQELIFCAHYDSKTELLDHRQREFLLKRMNLGIILTLIIGMIGPLDRWSMNTNWEIPLFWIGTLLTIPMLLLAWGLGLHLTLGRFLKPSQGAVDNGAACAILLALANQNSDGDTLPSDTKITLALFTGEEANMQGSRAYIRSRDWPLPTAVLNMEILAQDGEYIYWKQDGNAFHQVPTSKVLNKMFSEAVEQVTGQSARPANSVNSDGASFLFASIPATTVGTLDNRLGETGLHRPTDNLDRVMMERLPEGVKILQAFVNEYSRSYQTHIHEE